MIGGIHHLVSYGSGFAGFILHHSFILGRGSQSTQLGVSCHSFSVILSVKEVFLRERLFCCRQLSNMFHLYSNQRLLMSITAASGHIEKSEYELKRVQL